MTASTSLPASLHTPRMEMRRTALEAVFSPDHMKTAWKSYVRNGLRDQEVLDLFDYNDFHWNQNSIFSHLSRSIIDGSYSPERSMAARLEKKFGVCRTIITPTPADAIILQCIVENLLPRVLKKQPSRNAFFSRSHATLTAEFTFGKDYIWFKRWREFSKKRFSIISKHDWVVTTDIANFFDNVHHNHLRNILSRLDGIEEVALDILFEVIQEISWRPDYLPKTGIGLPQVQFDAPRLLAHSYLFEVDDFLAERTGSSFVRWVDDITFAVESEIVGKQILRDLDVLLQMRGLRLNSGKTKILSKSDARRFFHGPQNDRVDKIKIRIEKAVESGRATDGLRKQLRKNFDDFINEMPFGHNDKIQKRYLGLFATLRDSYPVHFCIKALTDDPGLRDTIYSYFKSIGPNGSAIRAIISYLESGHALDDASLCQLAILITVWEIKPNSIWFKRLSDLARKLSEPEFMRRSHYYFIASLWIMSKYGKPTQLRDMLEKTEDLWSNSEFLSRQVAASAAKFRDTKTYRWINIKIRRHAFKSSLSVMNYLDELQTYDRAVPGNVRLYILNGNNKGSYGIQRFLVAFRVLSSNNLDAKAKNILKRQLLSIISDEHYIRVLKAI